MAASCGICFQDSPNFLTRLVTSDLARILVLQAVEKFDVFYCKSPVLRG